MAVRSFLHRHSTLCGLSLTAAVAALFGYLTHWSAPIILIAVFVGAWIFPRAFYGRAASRALDEENATPDSFSAQPGRGILNPDTADIETNSTRLELNYEATRAAARGEFRMPQNASRTDPGKPTELLSRRATVVLIAGAIALCAFVFSIQEAVRQYNLRTHPHHWYLAHLYVSTPSGRPGSMQPPQGVTLIGVDGPYPTRQACQQQLKTLQSGDFDALTCREMTDADAAAVHRE